MELAASQVNFILTEEWRRLMRHNSDWINDYRRMMICSFDGDWSAPLGRWPAYIRRIFFQRTRSIGNRQTFTLMLFFVGNAFNPLNIGKWIVSSHAICTWDRRRQLVTKSSYHQSKRYDCMNTVQAITVGSMMICTMFRPLQ